MGRGACTTFAGDMANADWIMIEGSNMAECHPIAFRWVMQAKLKGAKIIHVDPRFTPPRPWPISMRPSGPAQTSPSWAG